MAYYCPNCGARIDYNVFFQITGQCLCHECAEVVDLTTVSTERPDEDDLDQDDFEDDS